MKPFSINNSSRLSFPFSGTGVGMWRSHLLAAWRNMRRNRVFAVVNVAGLSLAVAACLLIGLFIQYEWNYDRQSPYAAQIWRAYNETETDGKIVTQDANTHAILGPSLKAHLPEVVDFTRLYNHGQQWINVVRNDAPYKITGAWMADPGFLRMFPQRLLAGNAVTCLQKPYTVVLSRSAAQRLFGGEDAMGNTLQVPGGPFAGTYTVTGIVADGPQNTHLKFSFLASYATRYAQGHEDSWSDYWDYNYFQLAPHADAEKVKVQLAKYTEQHLKQAGIRLRMQPLTGIHLSSNLTYEIEPNSDVRIIRALAAIALFILAIAFVNYINLTTAQALIRAKEVSVRKVLGAGRRQLIAQFLLEGALVSSIAVALALLLLQLSLPLLENFLGKPLVNYAGFNQKFWLLVPAVWLLSIIAACLYPAFVLSSFAPIATLKGSMGLSGRLGLRRALVVFQFACSTVLVVVILVMVQQLHFLRHHDKGLSLDQVIAVKTPEFNWRQDSLNRQRMSVLRQRLVQLSGVKSVATSSIVPGQGIATISGTSGGLFWTQNPAAVTAATIYFYNTDTSFFDTYSISFLSGAPYAAANHSEVGNHIIINESASRLFGFATAQAAVGQEVAYRSNPGYRMKVHGVVADFHIESSKEPVKPTLYYCSPVLTDGYLSIKAATGDIKNLLQSISLAWKEVFPESHFEYSFPDEQFNRQYKAEEQLTAIVSGFTLFAIFITCLGLFGLAFITAGQRTKEIGIRKVLGASVAGIVALLTKTYLKLVLLAVIIASPVAWWAMNSWLQNFAYRVQIQWWVFATAAGAALSVAVLTIGYQSIKAAAQNPVKSLRTE